MQNTLRVFSCSWSSGAISQALTTKTDCLCTKFNYSVTIGRITTPQSALILNIKALSDIIRLNKIHGITGPYSDPTQNCHKMMSLRFTDTPMFKSIVKTIFSKVDANKDGKLDDGELTVALAMIHHKLARRAPGVTSPPTTEEVRKLMKEFDMDSTGLLTEEEFYNFARKWFEKKGATFLFRIVSAVFVSMVALPQGAGMLQQQVPIAKKLPKQAFTFVFGIVWKFVSMRMGKA